MRVTSDLNLSYTSDKQAVTVRSIPGGTEFYLDISDASGTVSIRRYCMKRPPQHGRLVPCSQLGSKVSNFSALKLQGPNVRQYLTVPEVNIKNALLGIKIEDFSSSFEIVIQCEAKAEGGMTKTMHA